MASTETTAPERFALPQPYQGDDPARQQAARDLLATDDATVARLYRRALWLRRMGDVRGAGHLMTVLLTMRPQEPAFWTAMGECCAAVQDHERAVQALARAAMLKPDAAPGPGVVAMVSSLMDMGMDALARVVVDNALERAGDDTDTATRRRLEHLSALMEHSHAT